MPSQFELRRMARLAEEAARRADAKLNLDPSSLLFKPQLAFVEDPSRFVLACCSRRAGKTYGISFKLIKTAMEIPGCTVFYVTNTRRQAERVFWNQNLKPILRALGFTVGNTSDHDVKVNQNELTAEFRNGSRIILGGANDAAEIENYRGTKTPLVILDEAQSFRSFIRTMIDDIFEPQLIDYGDRGQILMTGTPNPTAHGYFHDACHDLPGAQGWSRHGWTMFQNPNLPDPQGFLRQKLERQGWKITDPKVRREYFGEWERDTFGLVYPIEDFNVLHELPDLERDWGFILGIDPGYNDACAFVTLAYDMAAGRAIVLESEQTEKLIPDRVAVRVMQLQERYDYEAIVVDTGGLGKPYAQTMIEKYGIHAEAAEKTHKVAAIEHLVGDLKSNALQVYGPANMELLHDAALLSWDYEKVDHSKHGGRVSIADLKIDDRTPDHLLDAMLYAHRKCRGYIYNGDPDAPSPGTSAWWEAQEEAMWEEVAESDQRRDPWDLRDESLYGPEPF